MEHEMRDETVDKEAADLYTDLDHLAGSWSEEEAEQFDAALREQRRIDPEVWEGKDDPDRPAMIRNHGIFNEP